MAESNLGHLSFSLLTISSLESTRLISNRFPNLTQLFQRCLDLKDVGKLCRTREVLDGRVGSHLQGS